MRRLLCLFLFTISLNVFAEEKQYHLSSFFKKLETNDQYTFVNKEIINYLKALEDKIAKPVAIEEAKLSYNNNRLKKRPGSKLATDVGLLISKLRSVLYLKQNRNLDYSHKKVFHEFEKIQSSANERVLVDIYNLSQKILNAVFDKVAAECPEGYELNQSWVFRDKAGEIPSFVCKNIEKNYGVLYSLPYPYVDFVTASHSVEIPTHEFYDEKGDQIYDMKTFVCPEINEAKIFGVKMSGSFASVVYQINADDLDSEGKVKAANTVFKTMDDKKYRIRKRTREGTCIPDPSYLIFWVRKPEGGYTQQPVGGFNICSGKKLYMSNNLFGGVASPFKPGVHFKDVQNASSFGMRCYYKYNYTPQKGMEEMNKLEKEYLETSEKLAKQKEAFSEKYEELKQRITQKGAIQTYSKLLSDMSEQNENEKSEFKSLSNESKKLKSTDYSTPGVEEVSQRATNINSGLERQIERIELENETIASQQEVLGKVMKSMEKSGEEQTIQNDDAAKIQDKSIMMR